MKKSNFTKFMLILAAMVVVYSCSRVEENVPLDGGQGVALTLSSSAVDGIVPLNQTVTFSVLGEDEQDYTSEASFFVNQEAISGAMYTFETSGSFEIYAAYEGVNSNTLSLNVLGDEQRTVIIDVQRAMRNQTVTFSVVDIEGTDVTDSSTLFVNGSEISGTTFSSATEGDFEVNATYQMDGMIETTSTKTFSVFIPKKYVVVEDYTGTWCGFCPSVAAAIEEVSALTPYISIVAIHETANSNPDPYHFDQIDILKDEYEVAGLPQARIDRSVFWFMPYFSSDVTDIAGQETNLSIGINSQISGATLSVDVDVIYENGSEAGDKLVVYLLEDGLVHPQTNYYNEDPTSPYFGAGDPIPNFVHNHTLRASLTQVLGDDISGSGAFEVYERNLTMEIPSDYDTNELSVVVMVVTSENTAKNSQHAKVGEQVLFK